MNSISGLQQSVTRLRTFHVGHVKCFVQEPVLWLIDSIQLVPLLLHSLLHEDMWYMSTFCIFFWVIQISDYVFPVFDFPPSCRCGLSSGFLRGQPFWKRCSRGICWQSERMDWDGLVEQQGEYNDYVPIATTCQTIPSKPQFRKEQTIKQDWTETAWTSTKAGTKCMSEAGGDTGKWKDCAKRFASGGNHTVTSNACHMSNDRLLFLSLLSVIALLTPQ